VGADIAQLSRFESEPAFASGFAPWRRKCSADWNVPAPVIAAVNGVCAAGGFELCCFADVVIASEDAMIGDAHANFVVSDRCPRSCFARVAAQSRVRAALHGDLWPARKLELAGS
jgi:enoyl-CoA hydratase/carnithine racemase